MKVKDHALAMIESRANRAFALIAALPGAPPDERWTEFFPVADGFVFIGSSDNNYIWHIPENRWELDLRGETTPAQVELAKLIDALV